MIYRNTLLVAAVAITLACLTSANAEITQTADAAYALSYYPCSNSDLINDGSPALLSEERDQDCWFANGDYTVPWGNDGGLDNYEWYNVDMVTWCNLPAAYTFMLDTSTNTNGYDITGIDSFSGYPSHWCQVAHQKFAVEMSKVGDDSWFSLGIYAHAPFGESVQVDTSLYISLTDSSGGALDNGTYTATNIDGVRITYLDPGNTDSSLDGTAVTEIDVFGVPSTAAVPEPSTFALLASSILGLLACCRRKRN